MQGGDPGRNNRLADGFQWYHEAFNRGKRSMALDLRHPEAKDLFHKLVECAPGCLPWLLHPAPTEYVMCRWADVLAENFKPGFLDQIGFGYEDLRHINP